MTKLEFTLRELGELYEFAKAIRPYRITPEIIKASDELKKSQIEFITNPTTEKPQNDPL